MIFELKYLVVICDVTTYIFPLDNSLPLRMSFEHQPLGQLVDLGDAVLLRRHVLLELVEFTLEHFHVLEV